MSMSWRFTAGIASTGGLNKGVTMAEDRTNEDKAIGEPNDDGVLPIEDPTPFQVAQEKVAEAAEEAAEDDKDDKDDEKH